MNRNHESTAGTWGWLCLGSFVAAWDVLAPETLSDAVDRALRCPMGKYLAFGAIAVTGAHLANLLPKSVDPYAYIGDQLNRLKP